MSSRIRHSTLAYRSIVTALLLALAAMFSGCTSESGGEGQEALQSSSLTSVTHTSHVEAAEPTTTSSPAVAPSQSEEDARRDGVIVELANVPSTLRVDALVEVTGDEGRWVLSQPTDELIKSTMDDGCGLGDLEGSYPTEVICTVEYGEILLINNSEEIVRAYPMPGAIPTWIHVTNDAVYAGRIGDGGLPDSTVVRIDRDTLAATVVLIPASSDGVYQWPPDWLIADSEEAVRYGTLVGFAPDMTGAPVASWVGEVRVDLHGIDQLVDSVAP